MQITTPGGVNKNIVLRRFSALDGWSIADNFIRFAVSDDQEFKKAFTLEVLGYAAVTIDGGNEIAFATTAMIDNHLQSAENIKTVFEGVLEFNGIDPNKIGMKSNYWVNAVEEMVASFFAQILAEYGPHIKRSANKQQEF